MKLLFVDSCVRSPEVSRTHQLCQCFLEVMKVHCSELEIQTVRLADERPTALDIEELGLRDAYCRDKNWDASMFAYARQFAEADYVLVGAPYWDLSYPAVLKSYIERICVCGLTFEYQGTECVGLCKAKKLMYISTIGGYLDERHLGKEYLKEIGRMLGIHDFGSFQVEGLDIAGADVESMMTLAKKDLEKVIGADVHAYMEKHRHLFR